MRTRVLVTAVLMTVLFAAAQSWALWGKPSTDTSQGNADMKLGEYKGLKQAIGVKDFENQAGWHGQWELGNNMAILLESALYDTGRFVLVEREKVTDVLAEQDLAASGRTAAASKVAQTGLMRSAKYLATGAIAEVSEDQSGGGAGINTPFGRIGGSKADAQMAVIVKLIDTTTGEIVAKERIVGKAGNVGLNLSNINIPGYSPSVDLGGFRKTPLGQAAQDCINKAAEYIAKQMEQFPFEGAVIKAGANGVIINRGSQFGVEAGQELVMMTQGETLLDPETGEILDQEKGEELGKLKVREVKEKISYCDVTDGEANPAPGTVVQAAKP